MQVPRWRNSSIVTRVQAGTNNLYPSVRPNGDCALLWPQRPRLPHAQRRFVFSRLEPDYYARSEPNLFCGSLSV